MNDYLENGFKSNPYDGSLHRDEVILRYLPLDYFFDLIQKSSFWMTRVYLWREMDPCEATLLPVFRRSLKETHNNNRAAINFMSAALEFQLKTAFGCCFIRSSSSEQSHMWSVFCPREKGYGVLVRIRAASLHSSIKLASEHSSYFKSVTYLDENAAHKMSKDGTAHSFRRTHIDKHLRQAGKEYYPIESLFYKRFFFEAEKEVRAVIGGNEQLSDHLLSFLETNSVPKKNHHPLDLKPSNIPPNVMRLALYDHMKRGFTYELSEDVTYKLVAAVENDFESLFPSIRQNSGMLLRINLDDIVSVTPHPRISQNSQSNSAFKQKLAELGFHAPVTESNLLKSDWR